LRKSVVPLALLSAAVAVSACLSQEQSPGPGPDFASSLIVLPGYTPGASVEGENSEFTLEWTASEDADWYEIRISPESITIDNWNSALPVDSVPAGDSSIVVALVGIQPEVYRNTCIGCAQCVAACPQAAIQQVDGKAIIDISLCTACGECVRICPVQAISNNCFGEPYHFGVRAMSEDGAPSEEIAVTEASYMLQYANDPAWCGDCAYECFILLDSCGPGCPVDAIWYTPDGTTSPPYDSGLVHIDYDLCINCGQCWIQCHEYGLWSIKKEVVEE